MVYLFMQTCARERESVCVCVRERVRVSVCLTFAGVFVAFPSDDVAEPGVADLSLSKE